MIKAKNIVLLFTGVLCITSFVLLLFSFTQIDLSLTLSDQTIVQTIQKSFQHVGFYQRPLAAGMYVVILVVLTGIYGCLLQYSKRKNIPEKNIWFFITVVVGILFFSYPAAFSYDIFNYIFTAKTVLLYGQNPYILKPLDLQGIDPMLSFMRWTHLSSAYTPLWIALTLIPYLLSFNTFLFAVWMMKIVPILFYLVSIFYIGKILEKTQPEYKNFGMIAFAFHPLVIIEVLVSAHNDIVMMACALMAYYFFLEKKTFLSFFFFALSVAGKFITLTLAPLFIWKWSAKKALLLLTGVLLLVLMRREFLPWYMLWIIPFAVLMPKGREVLLGVTGISIGLLLRYTPVFYYGNYDQPVPMIQNTLFVVSLITTIVVIIFLNMVKHKRIP